MLHESCHNPATGAASSTLATDGSSTPMLLLLMTATTASTLPACESLSICDAGASCGICLQKLANGDSDCPPFWESDWRLHTCDSVEPGGLCEADGECGTSNDEDNCPGRDAERNRNSGRRLQHGSSGDHSHGGDWSRSSQSADVYRRVACAYPPSPPTPPSPPPVPCAQCDAGVDECGICLEILKYDECPSAVASDFELPTCDVAERGSLCEGDGECGTRNDLGNCRGSDEATNEYGFWRKQNADVYRVLDCEVEGGTSTRAATNGEPSKKGLNGGGDGRSGGDGGGVPGGLTFLLMLLSCTGGAAALIVALRSEKVGARLRPMVRLQRAGAPAPSQAMVNAIATSNTRAATTLTTSMTAPLTANAAPIGTGSLQQSAVDFSCA